MSEPVEEKIVATGIYGTNNFIQVIGDMNVIGQQINQNTIPFISPPEASIWFEVRKPVESFTGRKRELEILHKEVQHIKRENKHNVTVISQMTSISGLGGIGKSEVARMYARKHCHDYDGNVIWLNAETNGMLKDSFHRLAKDHLNISTKSIDGQEKDISSIVQEVYKYFSKRKSLFIFDNAEKLRTDKKQDKGIDKFLPNFQTIDDNEPYIIITSRNKNWGKMIKVITLDVLTEEEAVEFIKKELEVSDESQEKEIRQLAKTLQYFPLALQQAVAYIKHTDEKLKNVVKDKFKIIDYLKRYEQNARKLLNFNFPENSNNCYIKTTLITWEVTLEKMKQKEHGRQALEVLETIAYFAPDNIPTKIFLEIAKWDIEEMGSIVELAAQYSMINLEQGVINIHRLVQQVIRLMLREQQREKDTLKRAIKLLKTPIEEAKTDSTKYFPHAISVWNYISYDNNRMVTNEYIKFSSRITYELIIYNRYQEAYKISLQTLELLKNILRMGNISALNTEFDMTLVLGDQSIHKIFKDVFKLTKRVLGVEHPSTLMTRYNMALVLNNHGKYDEALGIYQSNLAIQERVLGVEHPNTLTTRHNIASLLDNQGKYDEALGIYQSILAIQERVLGVEHPSTLTTRHNMALVLDNQGKYDEALGIYQSNLAIEERVLGVEHPSTLTTRHNMALVLYNQGKYDEALGIYQSNLAIQERVLGVEHPSTLTTRHNMALLLDNQGKYDEALGIYQNVLNIQERVLGVEHPDTLTTRHNMALVLYNQGKYDEALGIYQSNLAIQERVLGVEHPSTLTTRHNMALVLYNQGKYDEALEIGIP